MENTIIVENGGPPGSLILTCPVVSNVWTKDGSTIWDTSGNFQISSDLQVLKNSQPIDGSYIGVYKCGNLEGESEVWMVDVPGVSTGGLPWYFILVIVLSVLIILLTLFYFFYWKKREQKEEGADIEYDATNANDLPAAEYRNARDEAIPLQDPATKYEIDSKEEIFSTDSGLQKAKTKGRSDKTRGGYDSGY